MKKVDEIELLRAVAIIFVLFQHLGLLLMPSKEAWAFLNLNNPYWGGVDLFFCISGFVISKRMFQSWHSLTPTEHWFEMKRFLNLVGRGTTHKYSADIKLKLSI